MEQEPDRELFTDTVKRIGYKLRLASHLVFLFCAFTLSITAIVVLILMKL